VSYSVAAGLTDSFLRDGRARDKYACEMCLSDNCMHEGTTHGTWRPFPLRQLCFFDALPHLSPQGSCPCQNVFGRMGRPDPAALVHFIAMNRFTLMHVIIPVSNMNLDIYSHLWKTVSLAGVRCMARQRYRMIMFTPQCGCCTYIPLVAPTTTPLLAAILFCCRLRLAALLMCLLGCWQHVPMSQMLRRTTVAAGAIHMP